VYLKRYVSILSKKIWFCIKKKKKSSPLRSTSTQSFLFQVTGITFSLQLVVQFLLSYFHFGLFSYYDFVLLIGKVNTWLGTTLQNIWRIFSDDNKSSSFLFAFC